MRATLGRWISTNWIIFTNASSMIVTTGVASALGFVYWALAARHFPAEAVGIASASVSAMMLLASIGSLGMGTMLVGELQRQPDERASLLLTALSFVGIAGAILGFLFAVVAPHLSDDFLSLGASFLTLALFGVGVGLTGITIVFDQAVIGMLRGPLQLWRNILFAVTKILFLWLAAFWIADKSGLTIYATWVVGSLLSLLFIAALRAGDWTRVGRLQWKLLRKLGRLALNHHLLNLVLQGPTLILPLLTTIILSATTNAYFYAAWMIARFIFTAPISLTFVLHAVGAAERETLARKMRQTLLVSVGIGMLANAVLMVGAELGLRLFGPNYAEEAGWTLRILGLGIFPLTVRYHYIAIARIYERTETATLIMGVSAVLELTLAGLGARLGGLTGLSIGWLIATCVEAIVMVRPVYRGTIATYRPNWHHISENVLRL